MNTEQLLTTGQFASLCGTTKETLFHYDRIGILKPDRVGNNGYRYYTAVQFYDFDLIQTMKYTGSSLEDIRKCIRNFDTGYFLEMFREKQRRIKEEQKKLEELSGFMQELVQITEEALDARYGVPRTERDGEEHLLVTDFGYREWDSSNAPARLLGEHIRKCEACGIRNHAFVGSIILRETLEKKEMKESFLFTKIPENIWADEWCKREDVRRKPAGTFASVMHKGPYNSFGKSIEKLMKFIERESLKIAGDCYVYDMISYIAGAGEEDYVVKIKVPVKTV
ncbi:MerR family transcriptional regulator [Faecalicatena contorta]|uniref:MerR family transcriptional regulator n=1 Tax=Faecalicatena fissicatena TaxID=290055 RepID=A0ABS2EBG7_9FIRM|nr:MULTISPECIES: MerR family transcriptional regulator [Faecalicatena]MBM6686277.1 MerR family transcriptional regulator [Faecalicatena contorta]MBM6711666.1 MerR family transcriptional regulator [Faecalicatena contorta]MBM6738994.1 MerR family transcriptional regulator [Faecalicatena fissicatena]